jgi:hypothetical protein
MMTDKEMLDNNIDEIECEILKLERELKIKRMILKVLKSEL